MYLTKIVDNHIPSDDVRSRVLVPGSLNTDKSMFYSLWLYCVRNETIIYCNYLTKKRPFVVLKPILYKDNPVFLQYCVGYAGKYLTKKNIRFKL